MVILSSLTLLEIDHGSVSSLSKLDNNVLCWTKMFTLEGDLKTDFRNRYWVI